jgi:hypothetical protein
MSFREIKQGNKWILGEVLWGRLVGRIVEDREVDRKLAERILDQAISFLRLVASNPEELFSPSPSVDIGWHAFILYTRPYADFCERVAGRFIHHEPSDDKDFEPGGRGVAGTMAALVDAGFTVDAPLWSSDAACTNGDCTSGGPPRLAEPFRCS